MAKRKQKIPEQKIENAQVGKLESDLERIIQNAQLGDALGLGAGTPGSPWSSQLSQVNTLFKNLRWYLVSNMRQLLSEIYVEYGLIQTVVDVPVDDGLRGGIEITSQQADEEEIVQIQADLDRQDILNSTVGQALKWNRLFGGAGIIIVTDQDPKTPLNLQAITMETPLEFIPVDMWELYFDRQNIAGSGTEEQLQIIKQEAVDPKEKLAFLDYYSYYNKNLHKSRVMIMKGITAPSFVRPRLRGWGFSIVEAVVRSINQYLKSTDLSFEVMDEFKLDIFKMKNLINTLGAKDGAAKVRQRVALANAQKNYQNALVMDTEDDYDHKQLSFSGLAEVMSGIRQQLASDLRMPESKIFGQASKGFGNGEDDIENYNGMVESQVRTKSKYDILRIVEILFQRRYGYIPTDLGVEFKPLRIMSAKEEEEVKTQKFNRLHQARTQGELSRKEYRDAINRGNLMDIQLDTDVDELSSMKPDGVSDIGEDGDKSETDEQGREQVIDNSLKNSIEYDKAAFVADGGEGQYDIYRKRQVMAPNGADPKLMAEAKIASRQAYGREVWQFVLWKYFKLGGTVK